MLEKLEYIRGLLQSCHVPALKYDLDEVLIQSEDFADYRKTLELQLPILYDFVQQQKDWIFSNNEETQEVCANLITLLCELTAPFAVYKLDKEDLQMNATRILTQHARLSPGVDDFIFAYYEDNLNKNRWKRKLGAVHGFMRYIEFQHNENTKEFCMSSKWLTFCLSVGLTVRECHVPIYKRIGTRIFSIMLNYGNFEEIQNLNIHSVIYDDVFKDVHHMDCVVATADVWSCICRCLDYFENIESFNWNQVDDLVEILLRNVTLAPDSLISICLLKFITKLGSYFAINHKEIESSCNADLNDDEALERCRCVCITNNSYTIFRWAKTILNMFIIESYKLMQNINISQQFLQEFHRCYMVCILPIPPHIAKAQLLPFLEKYTSILMEVIVTHKNDPHIIQLIKRLIETFILHIKRAVVNEQGLEFRNILEAFEKLCLHEIFVKNK